MAEHEEPDFSEVPDEEPPEHLRKKWEAEEIEDQSQDERIMACPHCGKWIQKKSFSCLYCSETVFYRSGLLGNIISFIKGKQIFGMNLFLLMLASVIILGLVIF